MCGRNTPESNPYRFAGDHHIQPIMHRMKLTVVICTHNRVASLTKTIQCLLDAKPPRNTDVKLLVVANACTDATSGYLRSLEEGFDNITHALSFRWVEEPTPGKSFALNQALRLVDTEVTVFVDDDQRPSIDFFRAIEGGLSAFPRTNLYCGRLLPDWDGSEPDWVHDQGRYRIFPPPVTMYDLGEKPRTAPSSGPMPGGGNLVFRTQLLRRVGQFSTDLGPRGHDFGGGEDNEYLARVFAAGEEMKYLPQMVQYHAIDASRFTLRHLMRLSYQRTRASVRLAEDIQPGIPLYLWRKLLGYLFSALLSVTQSRRRFYLVRSAAALGEIKGMSKKT